MFGKKKNVEGDAEAPATEPKKKGGKAKAGKGGRTLSKGGPNFFALHGEKLGMALIVGAAGFFVYQGLSAEPFKSKGKSEELKTESGRLLNDISNSHWDAIAEEREVSEDYEPVFNPLVDKVRTPTDPSLYVKTQMVFEPKQMPISGKRGDPDILPPINLLASNFFGAVAVEVSEDAPEAFSTWDDAEPITARRRGGRGNNNQPDGGSPYGDDDGMNGEGLGPAPGGNSGGKKIRRVNAEYDLGVPLPGTGDDAGNGMYGDGAGLGDGGMGGMDGMGLGGMGGGGLGGRGTGNTGGGSDDGLGSGRDDKPKTRVSTRGIAFNSITAIVPHKEMVENYDAAFENTGAFYADRDLPYYLTFEVQRADVTDDPRRAVKEDEWKLVTNGGEQFRMAKKRKWASRANGVTVTEVIDRNAVHPGLTMPIPPVVMRDYREFSRHPMIPWSWDAKPLRAESKPKQDDGGESDEGDDEGPILPGSQPQGGNSGGGGMGGIDGGDMYGGDMYGDGMGLGGMGDDEGDDMYGGDMYGGGMGGDMYGGGSTNKRTPQPEFKMIRCYDIVGPKDVGKVYRYRIRVAMRNPNYPETDKVPAPLPSQLEDDVWDKVSKIKRQDEQRRKKNPKGFIRTLKYTEWSEPSSPVLVRSPAEVFAGTVEPSRSRKYALSLANQQINMEVLATEPRSTVIAARMDPKSGAMLTALAEDTVRGGMLNIDRGDIDIIIPETKNVKTNGRKRRVALNTNAMIVDMRGGEALAADTNDDPLFANGEVLVLHQDGRLEVTSDIKDALEYRMYSFADQREAAAKASRNRDDNKNDGGYGGGYGGDEGGGGPGVPGF